MRAGFGLIGLLVCIGVIVWIMHKSTLPYTQQVLEKGDAARQQVNQMAGNSTDGSMKFSDSLVLEAESDGGKIASLDVTQVTPGGPAETYFGLKEGDAIVEIGPLPVKDQITSSGDGRDMVQDAYQRQQQLTIIRDGNKMTLPFFVLATQNPIEQEGTYPLPEAQLDRFMFNVWLTYPSFDQEVTVVKNTTSDFNPQLDKVVGAEEIVLFQSLVRRIPIPDNVLKYAVQLASRTRPSTPAATSEVNNYLAWGAGPRASQYLVIGAKCHAAFHGKFSPDIEDVKAVAPAILRHRIVRNYKAEADNVSVDSMIQQLVLKD